MRRIFFSLLAGFTMVLQTGTAAYASPPLLSCSGLSGFLNIRLDGDGRLTEAQLYRMTTIGPGRLHHVIISQPVGAPFQVAIRNNGLQIVYTGAGFKMVIKASPEGQGYNAIVLAAPNNSFERSYFCK